MLVVITVAARVAGKDTLADHSALTRRGQSDATKWYQMIITGFPQRARPLSLSAPTATLSSRSLVSLHVESQVVGPGEAPLAVAALERLDPSVLPMMPRQLIRASKAPLAALPRATVGFLTWKKVTRGISPKLMATPGIWTCFRLPIPLLRRHTLPGDKQGGEEHTTCGHVKRCSIGDENQADFSMSSKVLTT